MMKTVIFGLLMCIVPAMAEESKEPTIAQLKAKVERLEAELRLTRLEHSYQMQVCAVGELIEARAIVQQKYKQEQELSKQQITPATASSPPSQ